MKKSIFLAIVMAVALAILPACRVAQEDDMLLNVPTQPMELLQGGAVPFPVPQASYFTQGGARYTFHGVDEDAFARWLEDMAHGGWQQVEHNGNHRTFIQDNHQLRIVDQTFAITYPHLRVQFIRGQDDAPRENALTHEQVRAIIGLQIHYTDSLVEQYRPDIFEATGVQLFTSFGASHWDFLVYGESAVRIPGERAHGGTASSTRAVEHEGSPAIVRSAAWGSGITHSSTTIYQVVDGVLTSVSHQSTLDNQPETRMRACG